jgi:hypothetical protein
MSEKAINHPTIQRRSANRKAEVVLEIIKGQNTLVDAGRAYDLKQSGSQGWIDTFPESGRRGLQSNSKLLKAGCATQRKAHREKNTQICITHIEVLKKPKPYCPMKIVRAPSEDPVGDRRPKQCLLKGWIRRIL